MIWLYHLFRNFEISPNIRHLRTQIPLVAQAGFFFWAIQFYLGSFLWQRASRFVCILQWSWPQTRRRQHNGRRTRNQELGQLVFPSARMAFPALLVFGLTWWFGPMSWKPKKHVTLSHQANKLLVWEPPELWAGGGSISKGPCAPAMSRPALPSVNYAHASL